MIEKIDIHSPEVTSFYSEKFYFSYSSLNKLLFSPKLFYKDYVLKDREQLTESYLVEGKLLHCLLLEPEEFDNQFIMQPGKVPTGNNKLVVDAVYEKYKQQENTERELSDFSDEILEILVSINLHQSLKTDQQRLDKILVSDNIDYFNFLKVRGAKSIIDEATLIKIKDSVEYFKDDQQIMSLLNLKSPNTFNEVELKLDMQGVSFGLKGIVDNVTVDHESETIFVNDLKTTSKPLTKFPETVEYYRYDLQAAIYYTLVKHAFKKDNAKTKNYKIVFTFIVVDNFNNIYPYQVSEKTMKEWLLNLSYAMNIAQFHYDNKSYGLPYELATYSVTL
jgi:hypothetical protein